MYKQSQSLRPGRIEALESRRHLTVSQDANGFTIVTPSSDTQTIYVSNSQGSDKNNGLSPDKPVKSFSVAYGLARNGYPDQVLLKRGDTFVDEFANWTKSGRSADQPMVLGTYGSGARPLIHPGGQLYGFNSSSSASVSFVAVLGLQFIDSNRNPAAPDYILNAGGGHCGFEFYSPSQWMLVENCTFQFWRNNMDIEGVNGGFPQNITIRRCLVTDAYNPSTGRGQGIYSYNVTGLTLQQNVFDHNGWCDAANSPQNGYSHDIYFSSTVTGVTLDGNIIANSSDVGALLRGGGIVTNNLFLQNPVALSIGNANGANSTVGGVTGYVSGNAVVGDRSLGSTLMGEGMEFGNLKPGGFIVENNILTQDTQQAKDAILVTSAGSTNTPTVCVGANDLTIRNNIVYGCRRSLKIDGQLKMGAVGQWACNNLSIYNNDFQQAPLNLVQQDGAFDTVQEHFANNRYYDSYQSASNWLVCAAQGYSVTSWQQLIEPTAQSYRVPYADPNRSAATYDASLGGLGTVDDFLALARLQSGDNWRTQFTAQPVLDYLRAGFTVDTTPPTAIANASPIGPLTSFASSYTFTITYTDDFALNPSSFHTGNVAVIDPTGSAQIAQFVSIDNTTLAAQHIVTYQISPPANGWTTGVAGSYTILVNGGQISDTSGNYLPVAVVGSFNLDLSPPTATCYLGDLGGAASGATTYTFTVSYADPSGVDPTTLDLTDVQVVAPDGEIIPATFVMADSTTAAPSVTATYSFTPLGGSWSPANNGLWTISLNYSAVSDSVGNATPAGPLGSFNADFSPPTATASGPLIDGSAAGANSETITVNYTDNYSLDSSTLGDANLIVNAWNGAVMPVTFTGSTATSAGSCTATYQVLAPNGAWDSTMNGTYTVHLMSGQIRDSLRNYASAADIGTFAVQIPPPVTPAKVATGTLAGTVFIDTNGNGRQDRGERGLPGQRIFLDVMGTGQYSAKDPIAVTDAHGHYRFAHLKAGTYIVRQLQSIAGLVAPGGISVQLNQQTLNARVPLIANVANVVAAAPKLVVSPNRVTRV